MEEKFDYYDCFGIKFKNVAPNSKGYTSKCLRLIPKELLMSQLTKIASEEK